MLSDLTDEQRSCLERVTKAFNAADEEHAWYRKRWDSFWRSYHNYTDWKSSYSQSRSARDRDDLMMDAKREWGAILRIPYVYSTIETTLPRMLSHRPRMLWIPRDRDAASNTENMRWLLDQQQERMDYELVLQETGKTGLILGLGVEKLDWRREMRQSKRLAKATVPRAGAEWVEQPYQRTLWDDPWIEDIDPYDWLWDPRGRDMRTIEFCIHRVWRSTEYVLDKLRSGAWSYIDGRQAEAGDLAGGRLRYDELHQGRRQAEGYSKTNVADRDVHEVWEFHNGAEVITVLNRLWPVHKIANPAWHMEMPFHIFRPTQISGRMVGKSEPEPLEDLTAEMDTLRSQRRDNATLKLQPPILFDEGAVDPHDIRFGAGQMVPVRPNGSMRDAIQQLQVGDIANSSYAEEDRIRADIERASGLSDQTMGAAGSSETATGAQLVQAAASSRIQNKTRRMELELIKPAARQMMFLNQQRIRGNRTVRIPSPPQPGEPDMVWAHRPVGPRELMGDWDIEPLGGATAPENIPQDRNDAAQLMNVYGQHPGVDQRKILIRSLEKMGLRHAETYVRPDEYIPKEALELIFQGLTDQGAPPESAKRMIEDSVQAARALLDEPSGQSLQPPPEPAAA